jgi:hypothetical protein
MLIATKNRYLPIVRARRSAVSILFFFHLKNKTIMNIPILSLGLSNLPVPGFIVKCNTIKEKLVEHNLVFVSPNPTILVLEAAIQDLTAKQGNMANGGPSTTILRNESKKVLYNHMRTLGIYVSNLAQGNIDIILLSGFGVVGQGSSIGVLSPPEIIKVRTDDYGIGELYVTWKGVDLSSGYTIEISLMVDGLPTTWASIKPKRTSHKFTGLVSGAQYAIRIATLSSAGVGAWSGLRFHRPQ